MVAEVVVEVDEADEDGAEEDDAVVEADVTDGGVDPVNKVNGPNEAKLVSELVDT